VNDLEAAAEHTVLTGQIRSLVTWVGSGRRLTQTGRIGLADARHLVELLGTGDTIDRAIGDRVFKTKSSEELAHLTRIVEWAKAARLVRVTGTRLVPVKKNAALPDRPLDLVMAMLEAYPKLGKSLFPAAPTVSRCWGTSSATSARRSSPPCSPMRAPARSACSAHRPVT